MDRTFRYLKPTEIEVRQGRDFKNGYVELLLYKTARTDMNLLDEVYGPTNWQIDYKEVNGIVFCGIGIKNHTNDEWVWKWNAGAESNIEKEKGAASDAAKRAGFVWGIGRELYSAPRVIVQANKGDTFTVAAIQYEDDRISELVIVDAKGQVAFSYPGGANTRWCNETPATEKPKTKTNAEKLKDFCANEKKNPDVDKKVLLKFYEYFEKRIDKFDRTPNMNKLWNKWKENER